MRYRISYAQPHHQIITVEFWATPNEWMHEVIMQLPKWRPGRYELANYAKNVYRLEAWNGDDEELPVRKTDTGTWVIEKGKATEVRGTYSFLAKNLDGGGSWLDGNMLYINPVNCLAQAIGYEFEEHQMEVEVPENYTLACALPQTEKGKLIAQDFYELIDSPFIASPNLTHWQYQEGEHTFHLWLQGNPGLDQEAILKDFHAFTKEHMALFGGYPEPDFHFLIHLLPYRHYHGVEHKNSTVLVLGPSDRITERKPYRDLLGVASHELFHVWNVTRIRPQEMMPYDFSREAYHPSGYITEGITMYFGDLMLVRAGVYTVAEYIEEVNVLLRVHGQNFGKENISMVESSKDLWLDGYTPGAPERRQSIYVEGFVLALALDMEIRFLTQGQGSLEDVMQLMWINFGKKGIGYSDTDFWNCVAVTVPNLDLNEYYGRHYELSESVLPRLGEIMPQMVGYQLVETAPTSDIESRFGMRLQADGEGYKVIKLDPKGPAFAHVTHGDIITKINGLPVDEAMDDLGKNLQLNIVRPLEEVTVTIEATDENYLTWLALERVPEGEAPEVVKRFFPVWLKQDW